MASVLEFYNETDWEGSSGPIIPRTFDASEDLWPHGADSECDGAGDKDVLADGLHPVLAIGEQGNRPRNLTGVVITYESNNDRAVMNLADKVIVRQYVNSTASYTGAAPLTFNSTFSVGDPVYVDDSAALSAGVTLSCSRLNASTEANPMAGYVMRCQDQFDDSGVGGVDGDVFPMSLSTTQAVETLVCVMLVNDFGIGNVDPTP